MVSEQQIKADYQALRDRTRPLCSCEYYYDSRTCQLCRIITRLQENHLKLLQTHKKMGQ